MSQDYRGLITKIMELLEIDLGQPVKEMAEKLEVNRTFLAGYLKALENQGYLRSKRIGPARVCFNMKRK